MLCSCHTQLAPAECACGDLISLLLVSHIIIVFRCVPKGSRINVVLVVELGVIEYLVEFYLFHRIV